MPTKTAEESDEGEPLLQGSPKPSPARLVTVEPLTFLFGVALGSTAVLQPQYIEQRLADDRNFTLAKDDSINDTCMDMNSSDPDYIIQQEIAAELATWMMIITSLNFLPAIFLVPFYGVLSDRLGRKLNFAIPILAHIGFCIMLSLVLYLRLPLTALAFANLLEGLGGYNSFFLAGAYAYIADISTEKSRLVRLAVLQTVYFSSVGLVQVPIGYMIQAFGFNSLLWLSVTFILIALLYLTIPRVLLETIDSKTIGRTVKARELLSTLHHLFAVNSLGRRNRLLIILVIYFFTDIIQLSTGATAIYGLYGLGPPFCWSSVTYAYFNLTFMVVGAIGLLVFSKLFSLCLEEYWILQIAYLFGGLSNLMLAWAPTTAMFFLAVILGCPRAMDGPVLYSVMSKLVNTQERGTVFAVESSVQSAASLLSPLILNPIYSATVKTQPNTIFYFIAAIFFVLMVLSWLWMLYTKRVTKYEINATQYSKDNDTNLHHKDTHKSEAKN